MKIMWKRVLYIISVVCICVTIYCMFNSRIIDVTAAVCGKCIANSSMPGYVYVSDPDTDNSQGILQMVMNQLYPAGEYVNGGRSAAKHTDEYYVDVSNISEQSDEDKTQMENVDLVETQATAISNDDATRSSEEKINKNDMQVVSRNVVNGAVFAKENLQDYSFVHGNFYTVTSITSLTPEILKPKEFIEKDLSVAHDNTSPQILIFHTHSQETFADSVAGDTSTSIVGVGDYLTEILTNVYGYNVIHDTSVYDYVDGKLDRSKAYTYAENGIAKILEDNPSVDVVIDLHRDGVAETTHLVTEVDGKTMAKIMFFNGLSYSNINGDIGYLYNPFRDDNLAMSLQMQLIGEAYYPGFLRNIYINAYRYCLHERGKSMLIEAGAQTNTVGEVKNSMEPLADILDKLLRGEKTY